MRKPTTSLRSAPLLLAALTGGLTAQAATTAPQGFVNLMPGRDLAGWWGLSTENPAVWQKLTPDALRQKREASRADIRKHWTVVGDELHNDGHGLFLTTERDYADFELRIEYRTVAKADSGVYLRGIPQVQIWDTTEAGGKWKIGADKGSGGLWNNTAGTPGRDPLVHADKPFGEWNGLRIVMVGERVSVWLNGKLVVDHARLENYFDRAHCLPRTGPIQLQTHGGAIQWRSIFLREIDATEANAILSRGGPDKPNTPRGKLLFDGKSLDGWKGKTDNYTVTAAGTLCCKPGKGGNVYTAEQFGDFEVDLEIKLPPGGNNGLAIRYPGRGDAAYSGMCELQVLDNTAAKYRKLHPQQYHGSVYGQVAAQRGYLRAPGTWNFQSVTVRGSRIRVELNGFRILDADILKDANYMYPKDRFGGRTRTKGHFGFAGHNDPVEFRAIRVRKL